MKKCNCWELTHRREYGDGFNYVVPIQICNSTKEHEECSCNGDPTKCDFYPKYRNKKLMTKSEAEAKFNIKIVGD